MTSNAFLPSLIGLLIDQGGFSAAEIARLALSHETNEDSKPSGSSSEEQTCSISCQGTAYRWERNSMGGLSEFREGRMTLGCSKIRFDHIVSELRRLGSHTSKEFVSNAIDVPSTTYYLVRRYLLAKGQLIRRKGQYVLQ